VSLVARQLEENGISTIILGSALDIVEYCGAPRFLFTDFPLGNPCGRPFDTESQREILAQAFTLLESATQGGTTLRNPMVWHKGSEWKANYMKVDDSNREQLLQAGNARRIDQAAVRERRKD